MKGELPMNDVVKIVEDFIRPHIPQPFELFAVEWEKIWWRYDAFNSGG